MEPLVSIIVPVYNAEKYLRRCLGSIAGQTFAGFECILVDDGSTDGSPAICDEWAAKDGRFQVIHQKNGGASAARNAGIEAARAPWLFFIDSDDAISPCALELVLGVQRQNPNGLVFFAYTLDFGELMKAPDPEAVQRFSVQDIGLFCEVAPFPTPWGKLLDRGLVERAGLRFDTSLQCYEDRPFMNEYLRRFAAETPGGRLLYITRPLYYYETGNESSLSKSTKNQLQPAHYQMFDRFLQDCLHLYHAPPEQLRLPVMEYLNTVLYGLFCTPRDQRRKCAALFYQSPEYARLMAFFEENRLFECRYVPLRFHWTGLAVALDQNRLTPRRWFYWKFHWLCMRTAYLRWKPLLK
ncbi:glycosyltransferase family 2 protein [Candidatus Allofournierella excrementavium]|uniref:glycosyltransferase family 2 protein n=1 Tax=Candidatus Allofournierella excrementavium TaxID=2838591 RepID=UPI003AF7C120